MSRRRAGAAVSYGCGVRVLRCRMGAACGRCCGVRVLRHRARGHRARGRRASGRRAGARARGNPRSPVCDVQKGRAMSLTELELERTYANVPPPIKCVSWEPRRQSYAPGSLRMSSIGSRQHARRKAPAREERSGRMKTTVAEAARRRGSGEPGKTAAAVARRECGGAHRASTAERLLACVQQSKER